MVTTPRYASSRAENANKGVDAMLERPPRLTPALLTLREVIELTHVPRTTIYDLMKTGKFPRPVRVGRRSVRWIASEIYRWIDDLPRGGSDRPQS